MDVACAFHLVVLGTAFINSSTMTIFTTDPIYYSKPIGFYTKIQQRRDESEMALLLVENDTPFSHSFAKILGQFFVLWLYIMH